MDPLGARLKVIVQRGTCTSRAGGLQDLQEYGIASHLWQAGVSLALTLSVLA